MCQTQFTCWAVTTSTKSVKEKEKKKKLVQTKGNDAQQRKRGRYAPLLCFSPPPINVRRERERERETRTLCAVLCYKRLGLAGATSASTVTSTMDGDDVAASPVYQPSQPPPPPFLPM